MAGIIPTFNGVALSTYGFVASGCTVNLGYPGRGEKSAIVDGGASSETTLGTTRIVLQGTVQGTDDATLRTNLSSLLAALRGTDRVKYGQLDLYQTGYHYWCQMVGNLPLTVLRGTGVASVTLEFEAPDPYRRANTLVTVTEWLSYTDPVMSVDFATDFSGNAFRIPIVVKPGNSNGWAQNDRIRIYNSTVGWRFEHVLTQALSAGQNVIVDGETGEVFENGVLAQQGSSGGGLYLRGGVTNLLSFSGTTTTRLANYVIEFYDRFLF